MCSLTKGQSDFLTLTPEGFNCRTRVHEYGGASFFVHNKHVYFSNFGDQRMYCQRAEEGSVPEPITPPDKKWRYADAEITKDGFIVCVREDHEAFESGDAKEAQNTIVSINPETQEQFVLVSKFTSNCISFNPLDITYKVGGGRWSHFEPSSKGLST